MLWNYTILVESEFRSIQGTLQAVIFASPWQWGYDSRGITTITALMRHGYDSRGIAMISVMCVYVWYIVYVFKPSSKSIKMRNTHRYLTSIDSRAPFLTSSYEVIHAQENVIVAPSVLTLVLWLNTLCQISGTWKSELGQSSIGPGNLISTGNLENFLFAYLLMHFWKVS